MRVDIVGVDIMIVTTIIRGATALLVAVATPRLPRRSEANYCNSFQLTHMPRGSVDREQWRPKARQDSTHNLASTVSFGM